MQLILWLLVVATAVGQSDIWSYLPTCAQPCAALGAASDLDCSSTDYACLCGSNTFSTISTCCIRSSCDTSDDNLVWDESQAFCSDFGVSITRVAESACSSAYSYSYSFPTTYPTDIASYLSSLTATARATTTTATGTATAAPITLTNTISVSGGQATTVTITYTPTATGAAAGTTSTSSSSSGSSSGSSDGNSSGSGSSIDTSNSNNNQKGSSGLSNGAKIGIGVGAGVGGLAIIGGIIALVVYCCTRRRRQNTPAAAVIPTSSTAYTPVNTVGDDKANETVIPMYNELKPELDSQQVAEQQRLQQQIDQLQQQLQQQHNPAAVPASALPPGLAAPRSPVGDGTGRTSELHSESQGHYQYPGGGAQELGGVSYQQQQQYQYHQGIVTQAEMPGDQGHVPGQGEGQTRYELQ